MLLPDAYEIIKKRWPEVVLIVGFGSGMFMLRAQIATMFMEDAGGAKGVGELPGAVAFFLGLGTMGCIIVLVMLYLGFLRTAYTDGCDACEPGQLVRIGRYYFWRTARLVIILELVHVCLTALTAALFGSMLLQVEVLILLTRLIVLAPSIMVGRNMMVFESIRALRAYRLLEQRRILVLCSFGFVVGLGASFVLPLLGVQGLLGFLLIGCLGAALTVALLIAHLEALRSVWEEERKREIEGKVGERDE